MAIEIESTVNEVEVVETTLENQSKVVETLDDEVEASSSSAVNESKETLEKSLEIESKVFETLDDEIEASSSSNVNGAAAAAITGNTDTVEDEEDSKEVEAASTTTVDAAVENTEEAESIMEPSFTVLKGSKKTTQNTRLTSGLPMKRKHHLCCRTCAGDDACSPLCNILEDRQELCLCQQAKGIKEDDEWGIVGDKKLVYMERVRATPHGNETVRYEDVRFTGEMQHCTVCCTDVGHRYLGTIGRDDGREMVRSDETGEMMLMGCPIQRYFLLDRKKLKIAKVTFSKATQLGEKSSS